MNTVLITGAASGLGWALAQAFFRRGHRLCLVDINGELLSERQAFLDSPDRVMTRVTDITDGEQQRQLVDTVIECFGGVDILVNNAGITHRSLAGRTDPAVLQRVMAVDWSAPVELTLRLLPMLRDRAGGVINIGSMAGWMPVLGRAGYCSAKSALAQFFEVLRAELSREAFHILMVYPSFLATPIEQNALGHDGRPASHPRSMVGRMGDPEKLAENIVRGWEKGKTRIFPDRFTWLASLLWRLSPGLYMRLMVRRFAAELEQQ